MKDLINFLNEIVAMRDNGLITESLYRTCVVRELEVADNDDYVRMIKQKYLGESNDL